MRPRFQLRKKTVPGGRHRRAAEPKPEVHRWMDCWRWLVSTNNAKRSTNGVFGCAMRTIEIPFSLELWTNERMDQRNDGFDGWLTLKWIFMAKYYLCAQNRIRCYRGLLCHHLREALQSDLDAPTRTGDGGKWITVKGPCTLGGYGNFKARLRPTKCFQLIKFHPQETREVRENK